MRFLALALALLAVPASVNAQSATFLAQREAALETVAGTGRPFAGVSIFDYLPRTWEIATFHVAWTGPQGARQAHWMVRRSWGRGEVTEGVLWADSRTCAALTGVLAAMEAEVAAWPDVPGLGRTDDRIGMVMDGSEVRFWNQWARIGTEGTVVKLEIEGNVNSPAYGWWTTARDELSACWLEEQPS